MFAVITACLLLLALGAISVSAATYGDLTYEISNGEVTITDCKTSATTVEIPSKINDYPVTSIGSQAFYNCHKLTSVTIPDSVTSIGDSAFYNCFGLTSATIPDSVTSIGDSAFEFCSGLTSVTIGDSVTSIGDSAFSGCYRLTSVTIPDSVTSIGSYAFYYCTGLTSVTIPDSVTSIGNSAFYYCTGLTSVTIPDSVTSIGESAFSGCSGLTSVTIGDSVTSIGHYAFENCTNIEAVRVSNTDVWCGISFGSATANPLSQNAALFIDNKLATSVIVPSGTIEINPYAFYNCSTLKTITIPDDVVNIGVSAFDGCDNLTINCEDGSYALAYAVKNNIPYKIVEIREPTTSGEASRVNGKIVVFAKPSEPVSEYCLHIALYNDENAMVDYIIVPAVKTLDHINVVFKDNPSASYAKIFLWNSIESLEPITDAVKIEIK